MYDLTIPGWMAETELCQLEKWASSVSKNGVIVEVGSFLGRSSFCLGASCDPSVTVYCIDPFGSNVDILHDYSHVQGPAIGVYDTNKIFLENTKDLKTIKQLVGYSPETINYPGDKIDIFFLDASHANPSDINYINYFTQFIKPGGILCGHDYNIQGFSPDIMENVRLLEKRYNKPVTLYENSSLWSFTI